MKLLPVWMIYGLLCTPAVCSIQFVYWSFVIKGIDVMAKRGSVNDVGGTKKDERKEKM